VVFNEHEVTRRQLVRREVPPVRSGDPGRQPPATAAAVGGSAAETSSPCQDGASQRARAEDAGRPSALGS
jgi:hypothetical protein